jgi:hypothetical protein
MTRHQSLLADSEPPLQCSLPPREALRRAMNVKPPSDWKATMKNSGAANVKKATR